MMRPEIEKFKDFHVKDLRRWALKGGKDMPEDVRKDLEELFKVVESLQKLLPDDLEARREAAFGYIGYANDYKDPQSALIQLFARLLHSNRPGKDRKALESAIAAVFCRWDLVEDSVESEYYSPEPEYPEQWLEYMSEEAASVLYDLCMLHPTRHNVDKTDAVREVINGGFAVVYENLGGRRIGDVSLKLSEAFLTGGLELPDFIDEEGL